jgi:hypothetical protein
MINDTTDGLRHKALLLADEDWSGAVVDSKSDSLSIYELRRSMRAIYQCDGCGRLAIPDPITDELLWFAPEKEHPRRVLGSIYGNGFKVRLDGRWYPDVGQGVVRWQAVGDAGSLERFSDKDTLKRRYFEMLQLLIAEDKLGCACLRERHKVEHWWDATSDETPGG